MTRIWDQLSGPHVLTERMPGARTMHRIMLTTTGVRPGDTVLDLGCGAGSYFAALRQAVGAEGRIVGLDSSAKMLGRARRRVARGHWDNVELVHANATTADLGTNRFDAVFAMYSLSAMPDIAAAVHRAHTALRPGGRMFVADVRLAPGGPAAPLIRLLRATYRLVADATGDDVVPVVRDTFHTMDQVNERGEPNPSPPTPWPPLAMVIATKASD